MTKIYWSFKEVKKVTDCLYLRKCRIFPVSRRNEVIQHYRHVLGLVIGGHILTLLYLPSQFNIFSRKLYLFKWQIKFWNMCQTWHATQNIHERSKMVNRLEFVNLLSDQANLRVLYLLFKLVSDMRYHNKFRTWLRYLRFSV